MKTNGESWNLVTVKVKKLREDAVIPTKGSEGAAGYDLYLPYGEMFCKKKTKLVKTGIAIELPEGYEAQVRSRSGLTLKKGLVVANSPGTIDCDYRGEIGVIMYNQGEFDRILEAGDRIAQLVIQKVPEVKLDIVEDLVDTERGGGGFGSTGA